MFKIVALCAFGPVLMYTKPYFLAAMDSLRAIDFPNQTNRQQLNRHKNTRTQRE